MVGTGCWQGGIGDLGELLSHRNTGGFTTLKVVLYMYLDKVLIIMKDQHSYDFAG